MKVSKYIAGLSIFLFALIIVAGGASASTEMPTSTDQARIQSSSQMGIFSQGPSPSFENLIASSSDEARSYRPNSVKNPIGTNIFSMCEAFTVMSSDDARKPKC